MPKTEYANRQEVKDMKAVAEMRTKAQQEKALRVKAMCAEGLPSSVIRERLGVSKEFIRRIARGLS